MITRSKGAQLAETLRCAAECRLYAAKHHFNEHHWRLAARQWIEYAAYLRSCDH